MIAEQYCAERGISRYYCDCNAHNHPAQAFYRAMGGVIIKRDTGHQNKQEDQLTFEFNVIKPRNMTDERGHFSVGQ